MTEELREQIVNSAIDTAIALVDLEIYNVLKAIQERDDIEEFAPLMAEKLTESGVTLEIEANSFKICGKKRPS